MAPFWNDGDTAVVLGKTARKLNKEAMTEQEKATKTEEPPKPDTEPRRTFSFFGTRKDGGGGASSSGSPSSSKVEDWL